MVSGRQRLHPHPQRHPRRARVCSHAWAKCCSAAVKKKSLHRRRRHERKLRVRRPDADAEPQETIAVATNPITIAGARSQPRKSNPRRPRPGKTRTSRVKGQPRRLPRRKRPGRPAGGLNRVRPMPTAIKANQNQAKVVPLTQVGSHGRKHREGDVHPTKRPETSSVLQSRTMRNQPGL